MLLRPGHALIDRVLYLPRSWADDHDCYAAAGIPHAQKVFATKPTLAAALIDRAVGANVPAAWVAGDEVYGADPHLRAAIRGHRLGYVMAIAANRRVLTHAGPIHADALPALIPADAWQKHSPPDQVKQAQTLPRPCRIARRESQSMVRCTASTSNQWGSLC